VMKDVRDATARILDSTTLADVMERVGGNMNGAAALKYDI
jgi:DNA-binding IscR family transcriptional regulator